MSHSSCHCSDYAMGLTTRFDSQYIIEFSLHHHIYGSNGAPIHRTSRVIIVRIKWLGHNHNHSSPSSVGIKTAWSFTSTSPNIFMVRCLIRDKQNLSSTFVCFTCVKYWHINSISITIITDAIIIIAVTGNLKGQF